MYMKRLRIYLDTSVVGGCFDDEFSEESQALLTMARRGHITLLISDLLADELELAPTRVKDILGTLSEDCFEPILSSGESERLRDAYLKAHVVPASQQNDAHHVALATVVKADLIVSWNFKHIVHFDKMRGFNAVNLREGYTTIEIHSPKEVI